MSEPEKVLAIIQEARVWRLSNCDGCMCGGFELRNVKVDIACGKGRKRGIWVSSRSCDYIENDESLRQIGEEVAKQVAVSDRRGPLVVHCREWSKELD